MSTAALEGAELFTITQFDQPENGSVCMLRNLSNIISVYNNV